MTDIDLDVINNLKHALHKFYGADRGGVHISDLVYCMRKQIFRKIKPTPITDTELNNFSSGRGIHGALESLAKTYPERYELEKEVWLDKIVAHIDIFDKVGKFPIEAKTYRVFPNNIPKHEPPASQIQQLKYYMVMTDSKVGVLLGQYINKFDGFPFFEKIVRMSQPEMNIERERLITAAKKYAELLISLKPENAPHVMGNPHYSHLCKYCPYYAECSQMNINAMFKTVK